MPGSHHANELIEPVPFVAPSARVRQPLGQSSQRVVLEALTAELCDARDRVVDGPGKARAGREVVADELARQRGAAPGDAVPAHDPPIPIELDHDLGAVAARLSREVQRRVVFVFVFAPAEDAGPVILGLLRLVQPVHTAGQTLEGDLTPHAIASPEHQARPQAPDLLCPFGAVDPPLVAANRDALELADLVVAVSNLGPPVRDERAGRASVPRHLQRVLPQLLAMQPAERVLVVLHGRERPTHASRTSSPSVLEGDLGDVAQPDLSEPGHLVVGERGPPERAAHGRGAVQAIVRGRESDAFEGRPLSAAASMIERRGVPLAPRVLDPTKAALDVVAILGHTPVRVDHLHEPVLPAVLVARQPPILVQPRHPARSVVGEPVVPPPTTRFSTISLRRSHSQRVSRPAESTKDLSRPK